MNQLINLYPTSFPACYRIVLTNNLYIFIDVEENNMVYGGITPHHQAAFGNPIL